MFEKIVVFIFGAIIGSFLNVCIYRLPKGESIVSPGSHCPKCNKPITRQTSQEITSNIMKLPEGAQIVIMAPKITGRKGEYRELFKEIQKEVQRPFKDLKADLIAQRGPP